jgi:phosphatidylinositol kinase/protein kinase (PI-3  family)
MITNVGVLCDRCCEAVMQVLRDNTRILSTVLDVIVHDPMHRWILTPVQAHKKQRGTTGHLSEDEQALPGVCRDTMTSVQPLTFSWTVS